MGNLMILNAMLFLWVMSTVRTIIASNACPSRDKHSPTSSQHEEDDGRRNVTPTELWAYPFIVSLIEKNQMTNMTRHLCGGVIVNLGAVLTSCSCAGVAVNGKTIVHERCERLIVLAGTPDVYLKDSAHKQLRSPSSCKLHPQCNLTDVMTFDVALIFLKENLTLMTNTQPIKVFSMDLREFQAKLRDLTLLNTVCYQPVWFSDSIHYGVEPRTPGWIDEGKRRLIGQEMCGEMHCIFEDVGPSCQREFDGSFCAVTYQGEPPTVADTGGPLMCHGWVIGITAIPTCDACSPSVYVGPSIWLEFIKDLDPSWSPRNRAQFSRMHSSTRTFILAYIFVNLMVR